MTIYKSCSKERILIVLLTLLSQILLFVAFNLMSTLFIQAYVGPSRSDDESAYLRHLNESMLLAAGVTCGAGLLMFVGIVQKGPEFCEFVIRSFKSVFGTRFRE